MDGGLSGELDPELEAPWPCDACFARLYLDVCEPCSRNGACACASAPACASAAAASAHAQPMPTGGLAGDAHAVPAVCKEELPWNAGVPAYARGFPDEPKYDFFSGGLGPVRAARVPAGSTGGGRCALRRRAHLGLRSLCDAPAPLLRRAQAPRNAPSVVAREPDAIASRTDVGCRFVVRLRARVPFPPKPL